LNGDELVRFRRDYTPRFLAYLGRQDELGLRAAYELGRQAMRQDVGLLGLVRTHNEVLLDVLQTARSPEDAEATVRAASTFLLEALGCFEMTQRGFMGRMTGADGT
jgi:hypothetical protein